MNLISSEEERTVVRKNGVQLVQINFQRHAKGLYVKVKAAPIVEDLFRSWSNGQVIDANQHGRLWMPPKEGGKLQVYNAGVAVDRSILTDTVTYNLIRTGTNIIDDSSGVGLNLGFLRLKDISEGSGVEFVIKGVYEAETVKTKLKTQLNDALRSFYRQFLKPLDVVITVTATEME